MPILDLPADPIAASLPATGEVIVFDLEFTAWDGSLARGWSEPWEWREVIHIGAVRCDAADDYRELESFEVFVRPRRNPRLSAYITALTGITDDDLDRRGVDFSSALAAFMAFCRPDTPLMMNGKDAQILCENCMLEGIDIPFPRTRASNLRPLLIQATGLPHETLISSELPRLLSLPPQPEKHTGLDDARAIVAALRHLRSLGRL